MDPTNSTANLPGINSYVKRQVWTYLTSKYPNIDRVNLELIYNAVLLELTSSIDYEALYKSLQIEDEEQRLLIINKYLSSLVPGVVDRLAAKKNQAALDAVSKSAKSGTYDPRPRRFNGRSILDAFKNSSTELPTSDASYSETKSSYSQLLEDKYRLELKKLGNPSAAHPDFEILTNRALEETSLFQSQLHSQLESNPAYRIFDPKTGTFQDLKTSLVNQRVSKLVATGVLQPHGSEERENLIASILRGDTSLFEALHISSPDVPSVGFVFPTLTLFADKLKKTAIGELEVPSDPLAEFDSYTNEISSNSDSAQIQTQERDITSLRLSLDLATQALNLQDAKEISLSEAVSSLEAVIGFSETLSGKKSRAAGSKLSSELGISEGEFSVEAGQEERAKPAPVEKNFFVTSDVMAGALGYASDQSENSSRLSSEDREALKGLQAQVLGISGRMALSFETQEELENYIQSVRNLNSAELYKHFKKYTVSEAMPELDSRLSVLQGKLSLQHSNIHQATLSKEARSEQISLANIIGQKIFLRSLAAFPKLREAKETLDFLRKLKKEGIIPTLGAKKIDLLIMASDSLGLKEVSELLEKYKKIKRYYDAFQKTRKTVKDVISRNQGRIRKVTELLDVKKTGSKLLSSTRRAVGSARNTYQYVSLLQNDVRRTLSNFANRESIKNFVSKSKALSGSALKRLSSTFELLKSKSATLFAKRIKDLEMYASSGKLFSGFASNSAELLKKLGPKITSSVSRLSQLAKKLLSKINLKALKPFLSKSAGVLSSISKSAVSKAAQKAAYQLSKLLAQKAALLAAKTAAKAAIGAATGGIGFLVISAVEVIGIKRIVYIVASIVVAIIVIILFILFLIISTISSAFNSSTSDTTREYNTEYTYGSISGSGLNLSFLAGSLDSTDCSEQVLSWSGGMRGADVWDNLNKKRFVDLKVTNINCRIICNMARAMAGLQPSTRGGVKGVNCNPNYYNGVIDKIPVSRPFAGYSGPSFGYYACNYLTYSAYTTPGSVVDPVLKMAQVTWYPRVTYHYCNSSPLPHPDPNAYGGTSLSQLISNKSTLGTCAAWGDAATRMERYTMIPMKTQNSAKVPLCVPRELINPGDVVYWGSSCPYGPDTGGDAINHTGLVLEVTANALHTIEANVDVKTRSFAITSCDAQLDGATVPGIKLTGSNICRIFRYNIPDPLCPTDGSAYDCPEIISGTPGFMRD